MTDTPPPAAPEPTPASNAYQAAPAAPAYQSTGYAAPARWNLLAILSLVFGVLQFGIIPVVLGFIGLNQIKKTGEQGKPLAIIGIVLGFIAIVWVLIWVIVVIAAIAAGAGSSTY